MHKIVCAQISFVLFLGNDHLSIHLDVSDSENVKNVVRTIIQKYGSPPTIVINCAGIAEIYPFLEETPETFQRTIDINLKVSEYL